MKKYFVIAALAFAALVSCQKEMTNEEVIPAPIPDNYIGYTLTATLGEQTKSTLDGKKVVWAVGDKVAVYADGAGNALEFEVKEVTEAGVMFTGNAPAEATSFVAVYPLESALGIADGVVKVNIPAEQVIPEGGDIDPKAMPSAAVFETVSSKPMFYNLMSLAKFNVGDNEFVDEVRISTDGKICLAGVIEAKVSATAEPEVTNKCEENIVVKSGAPLLPNKDYYVVVAPAEGVTGFNVGGASGSMQSVLSTENAVTFKRNGGLNLGNITKDVTWLYRYISNAEDLKSFLAAAADYPAGWKVEVLEDIFVNDVELTPAKWAGEFDGGGKIINGLSTPIFSQLLETAVVENVVVAANSTINWTDAIPDMTGIAFIAQKSKGKIINCSAAGDINVTSDDAGRIYCAGIVGESEKGYVEGCSFTGNISVELTKTSKSCSSIAGVVARIGHADKAGEVIVKDCVNEGNIKFVFSGPSKGMQKFGIGGVLGQTPSVANAPKEHGIVEGCVNKGNIEWEYPEGGSGSYPALGGVAGIIEGQLKNASNYGSVSYKGGYKVAPTDASIGGVAGYVTGNSSDCHNYGTVTTDSAFAGGTSMAQSGGNTSFSTFGGVFGNAGPFIKDATYAGDKGITMENCTNEGEVNLKCYMVNSGGPQMCFGGVVGAATANMKDCHNKKPVYIKTQIKTVNAGGVCGYLEADMENCTNTADITLDGVSADNPKVTTFQAYFGGVFGMVTKTSVVKNVKNSGAILFKDAITCDDVLSYVGGIGGSYKGGFILSDAENTGDVTSEAATPICLGGLCGAFNGEMTNGKNSGKVAYTNSYVSATDGKAAEVGGLIGYANAYLTDCENTGDVTCTPEGGFAGGLIGSHGANTSFPVIEHKGCKVNCNIDGAATKGSVLGKFRYVPSNDFKLTAVAFGTEDAPFTISGGAAENPVVGKPFGHIVECLAAKAFWYGDKKYPLVKLGDGRWWMAAPLAFVPEGKTVSSDPVEDAGIWYTYDTDGTTVTPKTDFNDGYLYDYPTAFGVAQDAITYGTRDEYKAGTNIGNFREFEGAQGICPPGWYIPTRPDFLKLVGASNKDDSLPENPETAAVEDASAVYWVTAYKGSTIPVFNEAGWNFSFMGCRAKTSTAQTGAYNKTATKESTCSVAEWIGKPALNQVMCSTPYMPNVAGNNVQYFCMMSSFTAAFTLGKLSLSYGNYLHGMEVRCIRKLPETK